MGSNNAEREWIALVIKLQGVLFLTVLDWLGSWEYRLWNLIDLLSCVVNLDMDSVR